MITDPEALPPCDLDAERAVLGAILGGGGAVAEVRLDPSEMYHWAHQQILAAALALFERGDPTDPVAVAHELERLGELTRCGGAPYLITCMESTPTSANVGYWVGIVREKARRRGVVEAGREVAQRGLTSTEDVDELVDRVRTRLDALAAPTEDVTGIGALSDERAAAYEHELPPCLPTGLLDLDHLLGGGFRPGQLVVVAGRPGTGKSVLALQCALHAASLGRGALFASLEMSRDELMDRAFAALGRIELNRLRGHVLEGDDWRWLTEARKRIVDWPLRISDGTAATMAGMRSLAVDHTRRVGDLGLFVVDYVQLMASGGRVESRQQEVSAFSRGLKLLARQLNVPILAVSQLNRGPEQRADHKPMMSDLRESGSIEQNADVVILLHRPDAVERQHERAGEADLIVAKHRNGPTGTVTVAHQLHHSRFVDLAW